ncbi:MAG: hypothetical protein Q8932_05800 [Bacteroidota bacterium]|nr:hypothetical protein [Bacteroidota bacterium]
MRFGTALRVMTLAALVASCKKEHAHYMPPPVGQAKKILLKDITIPNLPSPFYHFAYNPDSTVGSVDFSSGFSIYHVVYSSGRISEMRVDRDTLRYQYDNDGKLTLIKFINQANSIYRIVFLSYNGDQVKGIEWDQKVDNVGYLLDRTLAFTYYPDGNVNTITEHRPARDSLPEYNSTWHFEQYDDKVNVDDFSLVHDPFHDHLLLFQGFRLQKNKPGKEIFSAGAGNAAYTVNNTYTYNSDHTPSLKTGDLLFTGGSDSAKRFQTSTAYTYY